VRHGYEQAWEREKGADARGKGRDGWRSLRGGKRSL
jgi:hypothetical protein